MIRSMIMAAVVAGAAAMAGCDEEGGLTDNNNGTGTDTVHIGNTARSFTQLERLGNPLVSEVLVEKREHGPYNTDNPSEDNANFRDDIVGFITTVAGRDPAYAGAVADALVGSGDMLVVRLDKVGGGPQGANVGWLTYALDPANGYGGRKLSGDDVVDKGLSVIFGRALGNTNNVSPGLVTDNVAANDKVHTSTFPYLAGPS